MLPQPHPARGLRSLPPAGHSGSGGGRSAPVCRRPSPAEQTDTECARPSRYAVAYGEPGPPGAAPLQYRVSDGIRGDSAQVVGALTGYGGAGSRSAWEAAPARSAGAVSHAGGKPHPDHDSPVPPRRHHRQAHHERMAAMAVEPTVRVYLAVVRGDTGDRESPQPRSSRPPGYQSPLSTRASGISPANSAPAWTPGTLPTSCEPGHTGEPIRTTGRPR
jgi:hypothetical protein